jgi:hypothetical protein
MPLWKAKASMSLMIDKREKRSVQRVPLAAEALISTSTLSLRTFGEDICAVPAKTHGGPATSDAPSGEATPVIAALEDAAVNEEAALNE